MPDQPKETRMNSQLSLSERVKAVMWFHSIDLGNGIVTPGEKSLERIAKEQMIVFDPVLLNGASVLDIGAWNGAYSFEAARRGARVLATDHFVWTHPEKRGREGFDIANEALGLNIETLVADVPDITLEKVGAWDIVLFLGVLYHLPSPLTLLRSVASVAKECLIVETHTDLMDVSKPALAFYPGATLNDDPTNFFGPNLAFVIEALRECGFVLFDTYHEGNRLTVHAWRSLTLRRNKGPEVHTIVRKRPILSLAKKIVLGTIALLHSILAGLIGGTRRTTERLKK
jgi:tRNA (mo5U34)-methyltransferase